MIGAETYKCPHGNGTAVCLMCYVEAKKINAAHEHVWDSGTIINQTSNSTVVVFRCYTCTKTKTEHQ